MRDNQPLLPVEVEPESPQFVAYIGVTSLKIGLGEIIGVLGIEPDRSHDIGDPNPYRECTFYEWSNWESHLEVDGTISKGTEGLWQVVEALSDEFADKLATLKGRSCEVSLQLVQYFDTEDIDNVDTGIHLTADAVRWIARAGALIDIDQYIVRSEAPDS